MQRESRASFFSPLSSTMAVVAQLLLLAAIVQLLLCSPAACSSSSYHCDWCRRVSTASLLPPGAGLSGAACGYGSTTPAEAPELGLAGGYYIAAASAEFFRNGQGCGACYQLRCRDRRVCGEDGVKVVVNDSPGAVPGTAATNRSAAGGSFILGKDAFTAMAPNHQEHAMPAGHLEVDLRRIPCVYKKNLSVRVEETSRRSRNHLAIRFLYQGGQTDIAAVEIARAAARNATDAPVAWRYMARSAPGVWHTSRAPAGGPLQLRVVVTAGSGGKWLRTEGEVIPAEWQPGGVYDTGLRVTDVAVRTCSASCGAATGEEEELR